jgi:antitoxin (DNA-binding transcriptional repressor) of toxin-antitoxin stability system
MSTITIDVRDLPSRLAEVLSLAEAGTEVVVTEGDVARARLVPLTAGRERIAGLHPGAFKPAEDFDAPLPEEFWTGQPGGRG